MRTLSDILRRLHRRFHREAYTTPIDGREVRIVPRLIGWTWEIPSLEARGRWCASRLWAEAAADWWLFTEFEAW